MEIGLIAALDRRRAIGRGNALPWHLPDDFKHFKALTLGKPILMGRKTAQSLGRALPGRLNVVVSRTPDYAAPGAVLAGSLADALDKAGNEGEIFVIGGADLYRQALPLAGRLYLTEIAADFDGDARFPEIDPDEWPEVSRSRPVEENGLAYAFAVYQRTQST